MKRKSKPKWFCQLCGYKVTGTPRIHYEWKHPPSATKHCNTCGANYPRNAYHRCP